MKKYIISIIITLVVGFISFYFLLPPLNIQSIGFWIFVCYLIFIYFVTFNIFNAKDFLSIIKTSKYHHFDLKLDKSLSIPFLAIFGIIGVIFLCNFILSPVFFSKSYSKRISIDETKSFNENIPKVDFSRIPLLDKDSSTKLGDRVMGQMPELVSQFYVSDLYTQINYNDKIVRVTPLEYNGFFKYISNHKEGIKGYIIVNSVDGSTELVKLEKGLKYAESAIFNDDLNRHLRFKYPTKIFGEKNFEIDNEGNPYWIVPTMKYTGVELKAEVDTVIILDPTTGESKEYEVKDVPTWVDHVYSADLIIEQVDNWGSYKDGFLNSIFGQKNVVVTTRGYNYTTIGDDVYLYTGITSVSNDESNIGFILANMRTKETNFYAVPGAEEYSAMDSAKGQVQQMNYDASFPLLINLNNRATYLLSLKDAAGLVKMYAFVDVEDYQKVVITEATKSIEEAADNYLKNMNYDNSEYELEKEIKISSITQGMIDGNSYYYIIDTNSKKYRASIKIEESILPFLNIGDTLKIGYSTESDITEIIEIIN